MRQRGSHMNAAAHGAIAGFKRRAMIFLAQLNRPMSLGRLWLVLLALKIIANILVVILLMIAAALR